jgi:hypothetical protein
MTIKNKTKQNQTKLERNLKNVNRQENEILEEMEILFKLPCDNLDIIHVNNIVKLINTKFKILFIKMKQKQKIENKLKKLQTQYENETKTKE